MKKQSNVDVFCIGDEVVVGIDKSAWFVTTRVHPFLNGSTRVSKVTKLFKKKPISKVLAFSLLIMLLKPNISVAREKFTSFSQEEIIVGGVFFSVLSKKVLSMLLFSSFSRPPIWETETEHEIIIDLDIRDNYLKDPLYLLKLNLKFIELYIFAYMEFLKRLLLALAVYLTRLLAKRGFKFYSRGVFLGLLWYLFLRELKIQCGLPKKYREILSLYFIMSFFFLVIN